MAESKLHLLEEERENLVFLMEHEGFPALIKVMEALVRRRQEDVLSYNLESGSEKELAIRKCLAEGASKLVLALKQNLQDIKAPYTRQAASPAKQGSNAR